MKRILVSAAALLAGLAGACNNNNNADLGTGDMGGQSVPAVPALGRQIDRLGRPAVNAGLIDPFDLVMGKTPDQVKDEYNQQGDPTRWVASFSGYLAPSLGIFDGLDAVCGNQLGASSMLTPARYQALALALADDQLFLDSSLGRCQTYLGLEANAAGLMVTDCGGRTPLENVIDTTYSALVIGMLSGVTNGVTQPSGSVSVTSFPFLDVPVQ